VNCACRPFEIPFLGWTALLFAAKNGGRMTLEQERHEAIETAKRRLDFRLWLSEENLTDASDETITTRRLDEDARETLGEVYV
jgi:hypothetical protein